MKYPLVLATIAVFSSCGLPVPDFNKYRADTVDFHMPDAAISAKDSLVGEHDLLIHIVGNSDSLKVKTGRTGGTQYIDIKGIDGALKNWKQQDSTGRVLLSSSKNTPYKKVVELMDKLQQNKIHKFVLITEEK